MARRHSQEAHLRGAAPDDGHDVWPAEGKAEGSVADENGGLRGWGQEQGECLGGHAGGESDDRERLMGDIDDSETLKLEIPAVSAYSQHWLILPLPRLIHGFFPCSSLGISNLDCRAEQ